MSNLVALPSGTELAGDFRIKRVLGAGGFGITYLADELALARQVTIKEYFPTDYAARKNELGAFPRSRECAEDYKWGLDRFIDEAKTLARFDHPNIVRVFRYFRANNTGYMVLQFEEGGSFKTWLRGLGRAPRQTELDALLAPLLDALELIHKGDYLHRDIAPDNIIVRRDKTPVLIDFGSARGEIASPSRTVSALVKPGYSPYEQYASTTRQQGPWTDIYALGATFYQAITGKRPPDAPSRMVNDEYVSARDAAIGSYRAGFLAAIDKSLRLEVTERPQSIAEWRGALLAPDPKPKAAKAARARIGDVLGIKRPSDLTEAPSLVAATEALLPPPPDTPQPAGQLLDFVDGLRKARPAAQPNKPEPVVIAPAPASLGAALASVEPAPRFGLGYGGSPTLIAPRASAAPAERVVAAARAPADVRPALPAPEPAVLAGALPQPVERRKPRRQRQMWFFLRHPWRGLLFKFATGVAVASMFTVYQDQWRERWIGSLPATAASKQVTLVPRASTSPATEAVATRGDAGAQVLPANHQLIGPTGGVKGLQFIGESRRVVTIGSDATLRVWDANSGVAILKISLPEGSATALAAQGNQALTGHADGTLSWWDLDKGERIASFRRNGEPLTAVAFAAETDHVIAASRDGSLAVWNRKAPGTPVQISGLNGVAVTSLIRVAARDAVAYAMADKSVRLASSEGLSQIRSYRGHNAPITALDSPDDGRALASAASDGQIRVWSTASSRLIKSFQAHVGPITALSYAPSGDALASIGSDGILKIWDAKRGRLLASTPERTPGVHAVAFAADGRRLATTGSNGTVRLWEMSAPKLSQE